MEASCAGAFGAKRTAGDAPEQRARRFGRVGKAVGSKSVDFGI